MYSIYICLMLKGSLLLCFYFCYNILSALSVPFYVGYKISDPRLQEISGIIYINNQIWALADGGNAAKLYRLEIEYKKPKKIFYSEFIDSFKGFLNAFIVDSTSFTNCNNVDWEELSTDGTSIFIGDFGNNTASRKDLRVYYFSALNLGNQNVQVDTISFSYSEQTSYNLGFFHDFDCEAMVATNDKLLLITKGQGGKFNEYFLPKQKGVYSLIKNRIIPNPTISLITGATSSGNNILNNKYPICFNYFNNNKLKSGLNNTWITDQNINFDFSNTVPTQVEAICNIRYTDSINIKLKNLMLENDSFKLHTMAASEASNGLEALLFFNGYTFTSDVSIIETSISYLSILENPIENGFLKGHLTNLKAFAQLIILDVNGKEVLRQINTNGDFEMDVISLSKGVYTLKVVQNNQVLQTEKVLL